MSRLILIVLLLLPKFALFTTSTSPLPTPTSTTPFTSETSTTCVINGTSTCPTTITEGSTNRIPCGNDDAMQPTCSDATEIRTTHEHVYTENGPK